MKGDSSLKCQSNSFIQILINKLSLERKKTNTISPSFNTLKVRKKLKTYLQQRQKQHIKTQT